MTVLSAVRAAPPQWMPAASGVALVKMLSMLAMVSYTQRTMIERYEKRKGPDVSAKLEKLERVIQASRKLLEDF